ncbi:hypothetical protein Hanom_Chr17g01570341 [Helianthus anomalus]
MAFMEGVMNCYNAFVVGKLTANSVGADELDEVHQEDIEEMDITWQLAMTVFCAKNFIKRTGRNN